MGLAFELVLWYTITVDQYSKSEILVTKPLNRLKKTSSPGALSVESRLSAKPAFN